MLGGDISNKQAPVLAFNVDNLLFKREKSDSFISRVKELIQTEKSKFINRGINNEFVNLVNDIWIKHPYSLYMITFSPYEEALYDILDRNSVNYTSLVRIDDRRDLRTKCGLQYMYYFDIDEELLSFISMKNALHIDELPKIIK